MFETVIRRLKSLAILLGLLLVLIAGVSRPKWHHIAPWKDLLMYCSAGKLKRDIYDNRIVIDEEDGAPDR